MAYVLPAYILKALFQWHLIFHQVQLGKALNTLRSNSEQCYKQNAQHLY